MADTDLNLLLALDALLAEGSVAGAARRLGLSASAMSRTLTRLRAATSDPLLVRAGRQMVLTPHAALLRERTQATVHEARSLLTPAMVDGDVGALDRTFTVRANDGFVEVFSAPLIAEAARVAPGVRLRFSLKAKKTSSYLREGLADLEIGVLGNMGPEVRVQALFRDRFVGVVRAGHPLAATAGVTTERYVAFGHVVASRKDYAGGPVDKALASMALERRVAAVVPSFTAVLAVVRASDLVGLVPASLLLDAAGAEGARASEAYHAFDLPVQTPGITVSQMWHPRLDAEPAHRWLRGLVLEVCRRRVPAGS